MSDIYLYLLLLLCFWNVSINAFPESEPERVTVQEDDTANLVCSITKEELQSAIIWRKAYSTTPLTIGEHVYVDDKRIRVHKVVGTETQTWFFTIYDASLSDQGIYLCEVSSREQRVLKRYSLEVTPYRGRPGPIGINLTGTEHVKQDDKIHLVCTATGAFEPPEDIHWFAKENEIMTKDRVTVTKRQDLYRRSTISELEISHSRLDDSGDYWCQSSNYLVRVIPVNVFYNELSSEATTSTHISDYSSQLTKDKTGTENTHDSSASEEDMVMAARIEFYREQVLTDRKRRQVMDTEKEFYEAMIRFLKQQETENTK